MKMPAFNRVVIIISREDYTYNLGGVNKVIVAQTNMFKSRQIASIFICPFHIMKGKICKNQWLIRVDGELAFTGSSNQIIDYLSSLNSHQYKTCGTILHHLKDVNIDDLSGILTRIKGNIYFYIHDYYSICPNGSGNLLNENGQLCNIARIEEANCSSCLMYKKESQEIKKVFETLRSRLTFIAPSDSCKKIWCGFYKEYQEQTVVIYHQKLALRSPIEKISLDIPIRIAYIGKQSVIKGWEDFKLIISKLAKLDKFYSFFSLGEDRERIDNVNNVRVDFHEELNSMVEAIKSNGVQVVLLLSICPETYSYTYYESFAANAFILAYSNSGNIADQIIKRGNGRVFVSAEEIISYLQEPNNLIDDFNLYIDRKTDIPSQLTENDQIIDIILKNDPVSITESTQKYKPIITTVFKIGYYILENKLKKYIKLIG